MKNNFSLYYKNIKNLLVYKYIINKNKLLNYIPKYNIQIKYNEIVFENKKNKALKDKFVYEFIDLNGNFKEYVKAPFIFMNEFFINNIVYVKNYWIPKNCFIYLYYENVYMFLELLQKIDISSILLDNNVYFIFGIEELTYVFSQQSVKFPENYIHVSEKVKKELYSLKFNQIEILKTKIDNYYNNCKNSSIKKENFKILIFCKGMGFVYYKQYISALTYGNFKYEIASNINDFSSSLDEYAFLNYIYVYKPNAILGINLTYNGFPYYLNEKIIIISHLENPMYLLNNDNFLENIGKNTFLLIPFLDLKEHISKKISNSKEFSDKVTYLPFVCDNKEYKTYTLNELEFNRYSSDISIIGYFPADNTHLFSRLNKFFMKDVKNQIWIHKLSLIFQYMFSEVYTNIQQEGKFIWDINKFKSLFVEKCKNEKFYFDISNFELNTFFINMYYMISDCAFRYNVLEWLIERDYKFSMWGYPSIIGDKFEKYAKGYVSHGVELSKVYNVSKISISANPTFELHTRLFEAISSNCLLLTYKSDFRIGKFDNFFKEDIDIVSYSTKSDLYDKIDYYLSNESKRKSLIKVAKNTISNKKLYSDEVIGHALENTINKINQKM